MLLGLSAGAVHTALSVLTFEEVIGEVFVATLAGLGLGAALGWFAQRYRKKNPGPP
jgi:hypothetical protein